MTNITSISSAGLRALNSSTTPIDARDEWRTPRYLYNWAYSLLGGINFDTACTGFNALAEPIWTCAGFRDGDAFTGAWAGRCWCNPPYSEIPRWIDYSIKQSAITAMLIPSPNGESYYDRLCAKAHEIHIVGRIAFIGADGKPKAGNTRGSSLFIINGYGQGSRSVVFRDHLIDQFGGADQ